MKIAGELRMPGMVKDIFPLWTAEKFDPEALMELLVQAGARYFVSMGVHHDNFDLWNSKHTRWNAVKIGPQRDILGEWQAAAKKHDLPFGVSEHLSDQPIHSVQLLGHDGEIAFEQNANVLSVRLPEKPVSTMACSLKIT